MNRLPRFGAVLPLLAALAAPTQAHAQSSLTFNLAAGLALPNGSFGDAHDAGYALIAGMGLRQPGSPISFRAEGVYTAYNQKSFDGVKTSVGGITGNGIYAFSNPATTVTPYIIGGIGEYNTRVEVRNSEAASEWDFGWNVGGGLRFPLSGFSAYVEARYHKVSNADLGFTPIVFGLAF